MKVYGLLTPDRRVMKPLACFAVPWCTGAIMLFNKHKCEKKIMQKIDKKLGIVYREAIYQSRTI